MPYPDVIDLFLAISAREPGRIAVSAGSNRVTYGVFERRARCFARLFSAKEAPRVLIALPRGVDAYAACVGAGLAGGYYAPVSELSPPGKLLNIAVQLQPDFIVASPALGRRLQTAAPDAVYVDPEQAHAVSPFVGRGTRNALAYIIFTSGSTGVPKGVVISRKGFNHYIGWVIASRTIVPEDRVAQFSNLAFDMSILDIYGALSQGATLIPVVAKSDRLMPGRIIKREKVTAWSSVPSVIGLMMRANHLTAEVLRSLRLLTFAGEPLLREHVEAIFKARADLPVQNAYGPTEATTTLTSVFLNPENLGGLTDRSVSIGPVNPGMWIDLVGGPHPDEGQIVIGGPQVAEGYWQDEERTRNAFRSYVAEGVEKFGYFSGDWAVRRDGLIYFRERIDFQIKLRGYRIELDEVASAIRAGGWPLVCVFKHDESLVALIEAADPQSAEPMAVRAWLADRLESYAVPDRIEVVAHLPRNENDKIDRAASAALYAAMRSAQPSPTS